jgi:pilus assembly protein CpaE
MQALLISDDEATGSEIRRILIREGVPIPASNVVTLAEVTKRPDRVGAGLVLAVLPADAVGSLKTLDVLGKLHREQHSHIIALGPAGDPKLVIRALRGIVDDYVDLDEVEQELAGAIANWRARRPAQRAEGRLIAVLAPSGGSGSSTLAANIATVLAKKHEAAGLLDLKLESGDLAALLDLKPTYTIADLGQNIDRMDRVFFERTLAKHASGVHLLAPPHLLADVRRVTTDCVRQAVAIAREMFPYVVADLDHSYRDEQEEVLRLADIVLVVLRLDFSSLKNVRRTLEHLDRLGVAQEKIRLVVNRYGQAKEVPAAKAEAALGKKIDHYVPDDPKTINKANNTGVPVVLDAPSAKVSRSVAKLAESVNGRHLDHVPGKAVLATDRIRNGRH